MTDSGVREIPPVLPINRPAGQWVRCGHAVAFVGVWMALGWLLHLDVNSYLLLGVPLIVAFQIFIRKKPLVTLWIRDAGHFQLKVPEIIIGICLAVLPAVELVETVSSNDWSARVPEILWDVCCMIGAFGAAFCFGRFTRQTWRDLGFCASTGGVIGAGTMVLVFFLRAVAAHHAPEHLTWNNALVGLRSFLLYVPVCFVLEEVVFRGAIDSHVFQAGDKGNWWTAFFVSTLWGWWHLPITGARGVAQLLTLIITLPGIHIAVGVFLSLGWRRSGNLAVPATVHAFIDAVRNALLH